MYATEYVGNVQTHRHAGYGMLAIERLPDYERAGGHDLDALKADAAETIANVLHSVAYVLLAEDDGELSRQPDATELVHRHARELLDRALVRFTAQLEGDGSG